MVLANDFADVDSLEGYYVSARLMQPCRNLQHRAYIQVKARFLVTCSKCQQHSQSKQTSPLSSLKHIFNLTTGFSLAVSDFKYINISQEQREMLLKDHSEFWKVLTVLVLHSLSLTCIFLGLKPLFDMDSQRTLQTWHSMDFNCSTLWQSI